MAKNVKEKYTGPKVTDTATFIQKARWVHGDKYDYSSTFYTSSKEKLEVVCKHHGTFLQTAHSHLSGHGCKTCRNEGFSLGEDFKIRAEEVHNGFYNYDEVVYKNAHTKVSILCPYHGVFFQNPNSHLAGNGCPKCAGRGFSDLERIEHLIEVHGDRYDYSLCEGISFEGRIKILCKEHGVFEKTFRDHLNGSGCPFCQGGRFRNHTTESFIKKASLTHGETYDYTNTDYRGAHETVRITCKTHGDFCQTPTSHLMGHGCPSCAKGRIGDALRKDSIWFIKEAKALHGDKYDYSNTFYKGQRSKVEIICKEHGEFWQLPGNHISKINMSGCPECALANVGTWGKSGFYQSTKQSNLYVLEMGGGFLKVGLSKTIHSRMKTLNKASGCSVSKIHSVKGRAIDLWKLENKILYKSGLKKYQPKESFAGSTECLELSELPKVLQIIEDWEKSNEESFSEISWNRRLDT